jgi:hypothetical protein
VQKLNPSFTDAGIRLRTLGQETFQDRHASFPVMAGLVPAIPMLKEPCFPIGITGTRPVMTQVGRNAFKPGA